MTDTAIQLRTVLEDYVQAALDHAVVSRDEGGVIEAHIDGFPAVRAYGDDTHECYRSLWKITEEWSRLWLQKGFRLPEFDGIDLNARREDVLKTYAESAGIGAPTENHFDDEVAFFSALDQLDAQG